MDYEEQKQNISPYDFSCTDEFRNNSYIDKKGNLVLELTEKQKQNWKQNE